MNPQSVYHAYAMTYLELDTARHDGRPVPASIIARLGSENPAVHRAVLRAMKDVERNHPMRSKAQLLAMFVGPNTTADAIP